MGVDLEHKRRIDVIFTDDCDQSNIPFCWITQIKYKGPDKSLKGKWLDVEENDRPKCAGTKCPALDGRGGPGTCKLYRESDKKWYLKCDCLPCRCPVKLLAPETTD